MTDGSLMPGLQITFRDVGRIYFESQKTLQRSSRKLFRCIIEKETVEAGRDLKKLMRKKFACIPDADNDLRLWQSSHPRHLIDNVQIVPVMEKAEKKRGRPKKDELLTASYMIRS